MKKHLKKHFKKYLAEFIGTFVLCLAVSLSLTGSFAVGTSAAAGIALGLGVYTLGGVSGGHFNPAITLGLAAIKRISGKKIAFYILAQLLGAAAAALFIQHGLKMHPADLGGGDGMKVVTAEILGAFVFAFGVAAVVHGKVSAGASGLAVGGSLFLGTALAAAAGSHGVVNPAVALAIGSFSWSYLLAPIVGAAVAMWVYQYVTK